MDTARASSDLEYRGINRRCAGVIFREGWAIPHQLDRIAGVEGDRGIQCIIVGELRSPLESAIRAARIEDFVEDDIVGCRHVPAPVDQPQSGGTICGTHVSPGADLPEAVGHLKLAYDIAAGVERDVAEVGM